VKITYYSILGDIFKGFRGHSEEAKMDNCAMLCPSRLSYRCVVNRREGGEIR